MNENEVKQWRDQAEKFRKGKCILCVWGGKREDCDPFTEQWAAEIGTSDCLGYLSRANPTLFLPVHFVS